MAIAAPYAHLRGPARVAFWLLVATLLYNVLEGIIAVWSGLAADSLVLIAFGADSYLEVLAAAAVLWRLSYTDEEAGERAEQRALRVIGATFMVLAAAVAFQAALALRDQQAAEESPVGIALLVASVVLMPLLALAKLRAAREGNLPAVAAEARETIACAWLSLTALAGVVAIAIAGWWWIDPVFALALVPWLVREGVEGLRGEVCYDED